MPANKPAAESSPRWLLRRADQAAAAGLTLAGLLAMAVFWLSHGGPRGGLIEIDRANPLAAEFSIDVNQADWPEIVVLPELGETIAKRIVEHRAANGPFHSIDDLRQVRGIGPKTLERIRPFIRPIEPEKAVAGR